MFEIYSIEISVVYFSFVVVFVFKLGFELFG